jgi:hypothetical protein
LQGMDFHLAYLVDFGDILDLDHVISLHQVCATA